jgi:Tetratricopeptide repeat
MQMSLTNPIPPVLVAALLLGVMIVPSTAAAQPAGTSAGPDERIYDEAKTDEQIYDEAKDLEKKGRYDDAIARYQKIVSGDRRWAALAHLADCYLALGRVTTAWSLFRQMAHQAPGDMRDEAAQRIKEVERTSPLIIINLADVAASPGIEVRVDDEPVPIDGVTMGVPAAPGRYHLHVTATGKDPWDDSGLMDRAGLTVRPRFKEPEQQPPPQWPAQRTAAVVAGSIGLTGLAIGTVFGGAALATNKKSYAAACDVGLFAGGGLTVGAVILWLTAPKPQRAEKGTVGKVSFVPVFTSGGGGGVFHGSFF